MLAVTMRGDGNGAWHGSFGANAAAPPTTVSRLSSIVFFNQEEATGFRVCLVVALSM